MTNAEGKTSWWRRYLAVSLIWKYAVALVVGIVVGLIVGSPITAIQPLGDLFLHLLQMLVIPLVLFTLVAGAATISPARLGRTGLKIFAYYLVTSAVAICIGIGLGLAVNPGTGLTASGKGGKPKSAPSITDTLLDIVPENPVEAMAKGNVLAVVFLAIVVGLAVGAMRYSTSKETQDMGELLIRITHAGSEVMFRIIRGVLEYGPIGVFALVAVVMGKTGVGALAPLGELAGVVYGGVAVQILFYSVILLIIGERLRRFFKAARDPMMTSFVTRSSSGTLPVTIRAAQKLGIKEGVYGFSLPLGATINMDGTALYVGAATVFVANVAGVHLTVAQILAVVLVGVLASIGTAGVPGAGLIMLSLAISQAGLPFGPVALVAGIDAVLDMVRTMCNVTGDLVGTRLVAGTERGMLTDRDTNRSPDPDTEAEPDPA